MTGLAKVFWGLLLVFFDFRIEGFDVLPDVAGFIVVYLGFSQLSAHHSSFHKAKIASLPLLVLSILDLFSFRFQFEIGLSIPNESGDAIGLIVGLAAAALYLYMVYHLCKGIEHMAQRAGFVELQQKANRRWQYYLWANIVILLCSILAVGVPMLIGPLIIPLIVVGVVVYILILVLVYQGDQVLKV
ncbi:hypothetical protein LOK74_19425 [Brevibacillus humidisoli]|uniref:hypothetical protein n=1 Tax=Brevibacillus humidisoli TaxID=2895522 RepID=UPI001E3DC26A|nr:hypothetical protein [Brevibacillus humidisoli]UFJ40184.1 hypothetical protein LOK74_19425 [Brevibacillus humidisoli]